MRARSLRKLFPSRRIVIVVVIAAVLLLAVRAVLPIFVRDYATRLINNIPDLESAIVDVDLHLWRGAFTVHGLQINLVEAEKSVSVLGVERGEISIDWRALLHGAVVGEIELYQPRFNVVAGVEKKQAERGEQLAEHIRRLVPLRVNRFTVVDGELHFRNFAAHPDVDIYLDRIQLVAANLMNSERLSETLVATIDGRGRAMGSGDFSLSMKLDPFQKHPTYKLAFELKELNLPELNTFLKHYLAVAARDGWISMYIESTASDGKFHGYVKPMVRDLDILRLKEEKKSVGDVIKGFFVKVLGALFENKPKEQLATKIEFSGSFENPEIDIWSVISSFLRNAFVQALEPGLEGTVAPAQVERAQRQPPVRSPEAGRKSP